jgi:hypothetical protein
MGIAPSSVARHRCEFSSSRRARSGWPSSSAFFRRLFDAFEPFGRPRPHFDRPGETRLDVSARSVKISYASPRA